MAVLFPPQVRDWGLPAEVPLTAHAARRVARDGALQAFDKAAAALGEDWGWTLDGKQIQRWSEAIGRTMVQGREAEVRAFEQGHRPASPANAPTLLVIGLDGGRVQMREKTVKNDSRWREDKIGTFTTYLPEDNVARASLKPSGYSIGFAESNWSRGQGGPHEATTLYCDGHAL